MSAIGYLQTRPGRRKRSYRQARPLTYVVLLLLVVLSVFPLYWSFVVASHDNSALGAYPPVLTPGGEFWENVQRLFNAGIVNVEFRTALVNSAIVAAVVTVSVVFFSALAGFAFAKLQFRGRKLLFVVVIATMIVPVQLGVIPLYIQMNQFGWINHLQAVIAPFLVSAFGVFLMRQYISGAVPNELLDAARVDGCRTARVFWHVVLPAVRPIAAVLGLLTFMNTWNDFFWPLIVLSPSNPTVQVAVSTISGAAYVPDYALILTGTFISILPLLIVFLVLGRQIIGGIMKGAVKGGASVARLRRAPAGEIPGSSWGEPHELPRGLRVGCRHGCLPDRGRDDGRRPRRVDLGPLREHARQGAERGHRRSRVRALLPVGGGSRPRPLAGPPGLPLLDLVATHPAERARSREPARDRLLPAARRRAARAWHLPARDAVPLGPAAGSRG